MFPYPSGRGGILYQWKTGEMVKRMAIGKARFVTNKESEGKIWSVNLGRESALLANFSSSVPISRPI